MEFCVVCTPASGDCKILYIVEENLNLCIGICYLYECVIKCTEKSKCSDANVEVRYSYKEV